MAEVLIVSVQIEPPKGTFSGRIVEGCYVIDDGTVVLTTRSGEPVRDDEGKEYKHKLVDGDNPKQIAGLLTKKFRKVLRGNNARPRGFGSGPIDCPNKPWKKV